VLGKIRGGLLVGAQDYTRLGERDSWRAARIPNPEIVGVRMTGHDEGAANANPWNVSVFQSNWTAGAEPGARATARVKT